MQACVHVEMAQGLRVLDALPEDPGPVLRILVTAHNCISSPRGSNVIFWPPWYAYIYMQTYIHTARQTTQKNKK